jgi:hypothetical protein
VQGGFMENQKLIDFYSKNLEKLDNEWKKNCFDGKRSIRESGDLYFNSKAFWEFVVKKFRKKHE